MEYKSPKESNIENIEVMTGFKTPSLLLLLPSLLLIVAFNNESKGCIYIDTPEKSSHLVSIIALISEDEANAKLIVFNAAY